MGGGLEPASYLIINILNKIWRPNEQKFYEGSGLVTPSRGVSGQTSAIMNQHFSSTSTLNLIYLQGQLREKIQGGWGRVRFRAKIQPS